jgi:AAA domain
VVNIERPVTIAAAGAHSTGKSTFLARLAHALRRCDLEVATVADLGEEALRIGLPILHSHTYASTLWIMTRGISQEIATWAHVDVLLIDRPVPDALGYYHAALAYRQETPDPEAMRHLRSVAAHHSVHYDLIYRTTLDERLPLGANKPRDRDRRFRSLTDIHVQQVLTDLAIAHNVLAVDGHPAAVDDAVRFALDRLVSARPDLCAEPPR